MKVYELDEPYWHPRKKTMCNYVVKSEDNKRVMSYCTDEADARDFIRNQLGWKSLMVIQRSEK